MRTCDVDGCDRIHRARGLCAMHYRRVERAEGRARPPSSLWGERRRANWRKRRALRHGAETAETILYAAVLDRDGWICQLCDEPIDPDLDAPNPRAATVDHRIPLTAGGPHTLDNVQAAHFGCNARKGSRPPTDPHRLTGNTPERVGGDPGEAGH